MKAPRKRTRRDEEYLTIATGYHILRSPLAGSYRAAAEHYRQSDPPADAGDKAENVAAPEQNENVAAREQKAARH